MLHIMSSYKKNKLIKLKENNIIEARMVMENSDSCSLYIHYFKLKFKDWWTMSSWFPDLPIAVGMNICLHFIFHGLNLDYLADTFAITQILDLLRDKLTNFEVSSKYLSMDFANDNSKSFGLHSLHSLHAKESQKILE